MFSKILATAALAAFAHADGHSGVEPEPHSDYQRWGDVMDKEGYTWDAYKARTDDGWHLTLFRITGRQNEGSDMKKHETPVLVQHGFGMSAVSWAEWNFGETPWPLQLVDRGYDVWMSSTRGTTYSNVNERDGQWTDEERWNFSQKEMGTYDQPANIKKILEVTGKDELTYIGYSQGNQQMFYGLATNFDFFDEHLRDAILISPCIYGPGTEQDLLEYNEYKEIGVYKIGGDNWVDDKNTICEKMSVEKCTFWGYWPDDLEAGPFNSLSYTLQNYIEGYKEPIPIEEYAAGRRSSPSIDLGEIEDSLPITFFIGDQDQTCTPELSERIYDEMVNADVTKTYDEGFTHETYGYVGSKEFVDKMCMAIEHGKMKAADGHDGDHEGDMWEGILMIFTMSDGASNLLAASAVALSTLALAF